MTEVTSNCYHEVFGYKQEKGTLGPLGGAALGRPTLGFSSGHDVRVVRWSPVLGSGLSEESPEVSVSLSLSPSPCLCSHSVSLK